MREPTVEWMAMAARAEAFLKARLPDDPEFPELRVFKLLVRKLILEDTVFRGERAEILEFEGPARRIRDVTRQGLAELLAKQRPGAGLQDSDAPRRIIKACRRALAEAEAAGKDAGLLEGMRSLITLYEHTQKLVADYGPQLRKLEINLQATWTGLERMLLLADDVIALEFESQEEVLAEWREVRRAA